MTEKRYLQQDGAVFYPNTHWEAVAGTDKIWEEAHRLLITGDDGKTYRLGVKLDDDKKPVLYAEEYQGGDDNANTIR